MIVRHDLSQLDWTVSGWAPHGWRFLRSMETGSSSLAEFPPMPARVPGSVQQSLRDAGTIDDWNVGFNSLSSEWVENRHWIYTAVIPAAMTPKTGSMRLHCAGLDYSGWLLVNRVEVAAFCGSHVPHVFDLTAHLGDEDITVELIFDTPPRWLGQFGFTSQMTDWKPRYNYTWDWTGRVVQLGIWDAITLEATDGEEFAAFNVTPGADWRNATGRLSVSGEIAGLRGQSVRVDVTRGTQTVLSETIDSIAFTQGREWGGFGVDLWQPNGNGDQPLYEVTATLLDSDGNTLDTATRTVGFRDIEWGHCQDEPEGAEPWICLLNGKATFLQGVNWTPIRPNFADVTDDHYRALLTQYRDLGANMLRVWGGGFLEKEIFYELCDELGILVWQEFPLSSSGAENWPPEDAKSIAEMSAIVHSYIARRRHHACLTMWCGGNELQGGLDGEKLGIGRPVDYSHPMMAMMRSVVASDDPGRRFVPSSSSGPRFLADAADFGKGLHHDVHGPWALGSMNFDEWTSYWTSDDALFRSESGAPGASDAALIREFAGECPVTPGTLANALWRRTSWWIEWPAFVKETGHEPESLEEYVTWSQARQARALGIAVGAAKARFPRCGGILLWMGHDSFPCPANTAIIDFHGKPKPAALAVSEVWKRPAG